MSSEQRHHHELREETRLHALQHAPSEASTLRLAELHRPHQSEAANLPHGVVRLHERLGQLGQPLAEFLGALDELRLVQLAQGCKPGGHCKVVRREGRAVADRMLEGVEDSVVDVLGHQQCADRHVAARQ